MINNITNNMNSDEIIYYEDEVDNLINRLMPTSLANKKRSDISSGSSILKTYLPESDIDLVLFTDINDDSNNSNNSNNDDSSSKSLSDCNIDDTKNVFRIFNTLCDEIVAKENGTSMNNDMTIRNVEFINARTKVVHCFVNNINIDITINQMGAVATAAFLEEADRLIGYDHLLKKSLLLIKCWCLNESIKYCGQPILGAKQGMFSSYAISVLVLNLFNQQPNNLTHPFSVLRAFLSTYATFRWDNIILTIDGSIPITSTTSMKIPQISKSGNVFEPLSSQLQSLISKSKYKKRTTSEFPIRCCCILDPIDRNNNLGMSISRQNLIIINQALKNGYHHLETILAWNKEQNNHVHVLLNLFFPGSYNLYMVDGMVRCDLRDHPLQKYSTYEKSMTSSNSKESDSTTTDALQTNLTSLWATLYGQVGLNADEEGGSSMRKSGASSPPSVAVTYSLSSSIFSPGSSDEGNNTINDDECIGIIETKISNDVNMNNDNDNNSGNANIVLKIEDIDYTMPQSPRYIVTDFDRDTNALWMEALTPSSRQYLMSKSLKTSVVDKEIQTDEVQLVTQCTNNSNDSVNRKSDITVTTVPSIPKGDENPKNNNNNNSYNNNDNNDIASKSNHIGTNNTGPKKKGKNKEKNNNISNSNNHNANRNNVSSNSNNTSNDKVKNIVTDNSTLNSSSVYSQLKTVKVSVIIVSVIVAVIAITMRLMHSGNSISISNEKKDIEISTSVDVIVPKDFNKRVNYWIVKGDSLSFGEISYIETLAAALSQVNDKMISESIAHNSLFQWRKDGLNMTNPSRDATLYTIRDSKHSDTGVYTLATVGGNVCGLILTEIKISMSLAPNVKSKPKYFNEKKKGETFRVELTGEGMPPPTYQWYRNGVQLAGKVDNVLIIENLDKSDGGTYSCELVNIAGKYLFQEVIVVVS